MSATNYLVDICHMFDGDGPLHWKGVITRFLESLNYYPIQVRSCDPCCVVSLLFVSLLL